jgi:beta-glucosidase
VQVYLESDGTDAARPVRWLAGFAVAQVDAGETTTVRIPVTRRSFEIWQSGSGWVLPIGQYRLYAGRSSRDLLLDVVVGVDTPADSEASRL